MYRTFNVLEHWYNSILFDLKITLMIIDLFAKILFIFQYLNGSLKSVIF